MPLFQILKGDADPNSPRHMTQEAHQALDLVETAIEQSIYVCHT